MHTSVPSEGRKKESLLHIIGAMIAQLGLGIFLFTTTSRTALGSIQLPVQWVPGALSLGIKQLGREADHSPPSSAEVEECVELYHHSSNMPSWHGSWLKKAQGQLYLYILLLFVECMLNFTRTGTSHYILFYIAHPQYVYQNLGIFQGGRTVLFLIR
jgi:hypothetical protein